jgi:hypothetical protein
MAQEREAHMSGIPMSAGVIQTIRRMTLGTLFIALITGAGCSTLQVDALERPGADFGNRGTFRIVERAPNVDSVRPIRTSNVMLNNSIIDQMLRYDIQRAFEARGYTMSSVDPDFEVVYFARAIDRLEVSNVDRGYYGYYGYYGYRDVDVYEYTEGTVVIDVVDPDSKELLWRGSGVATVSDNPRKYARQLNEAVGEIVERFPPAMVVTPLESDYRESEAEGWGESL